MTDILGSIARCAELEDENARLKSENARLKDEIERLYDAARGSDEDRKARLAYILTGQRY